VVGPSFQRPGARSGALRRSVVGQHRHRAPEITLVHAIAATICSSRVTIAHIDFYDALAVADPDNRAAVADGA